MGKRHYQLIDDKDPDPVGEHTARVSVATCTNCKIEDQETHPKHWKARFVGVQFEGNPKFCPQCGYALFYYRRRRNG